jgi:hypothetical protein
VERFQTFVKSSFSFFISPILAVAVWALLFQGGTTNKFAIATVSFTIGLVTDEIIQKLIEFTRSILKGIRGTSTPAPTRLP